MVNGENPRKMRMRKNKVRVRNLRLPRKIHHYSGFICKGHKIRIDAKHKSSGEPKFWLKIRNILCDNLLEPNIIGEVSAERAGREYRPIEMIIM